MVKLGSNNLLSRPRDPPVFHKLPHIPENVVLYHMKERG